MPVVEDDMPVPHDGSHLTDWQRDVILAYMRSVLDILHLGRWKIELSDDLPPQDARAMISPVEGRVVATLYVQADWWSESTDEEKAHDLIHEALHLAHHDADTTVRRFLNQSDDISTSTKVLVGDRFKLDLERMVDSLANALVPLLPDWGHPR